MSTRFLHRLAMVSVAGLALAGPAAAQNKAEKNDKSDRAAKADKQPTNGVLWFETGDWDAILVSPKDQALKRAIKMLPARLREVKGELPPDAPVPTEALDLAGRLLSSPVRAAFAYNPEQQTGGFFGGGAVLSFLTGAEAEAGKTGSLVNALVKLSPFKPKESKAFAGMSEVLLPFGTIRGGPRQTAKGWAYDLHVGTMSEPDTILGELDTIAISGVKPYFKARFDAAPLNPLMDFIEMMAGDNPQAADGIAKIKESGVLGPKGVKGTYLCGYAEDRSVSETRISGLAGAATALGMSKTPLTDADLKVIPADAHWGIIGSFESTYLTQQVQSALELPDARAAVDQFKQMTGVDPVADLLAPLGGTFALYLADSTGGGGLMSMVVVTGVTDPQKFSGAIGKLTTMANGILAEEDKAKGYVLVRDWAHESAPGAKFQSLSFPGLPVPIEVTYAFAGKWVVAGLTPQAALVAARQAMGKGDGGITTNERIGAAMPKGKSMVSFTFNDPAKTLREGYAVASMAGSALGNLMRTRGKAKEVREPGLVTPPYADLLAGARGQVSWTTWEGDEYVQRSEGDRSQLVDLSMRAGQLMPFLPLISLGGAGAAAAGFQEAQRQGMVPGPMDDFGGGDDGEAGGKKPGF